MDSLEAMDHIDRMFLSIDESLWLPQWSFDFWIIPYLLGRGISETYFREFMTVADRLLTTQIASVPESQKKSMQQQDLGNLVNKIKNWKLA